MKSKDTRYVFLPTPSLDPDRFHTLTFTRLRRQRAQVYVCPHCRLASIVTVLQSREAFLAHLAKAHPLNSLDKLTEKE